MRIGRQGNWGQTLDLVRVQDLGLLGQDDPTVLKWAAERLRLLLTHDRATMPAHAYERVRGKLPMPGIIVADDRMPIGQAVQDSLLIATCSQEGEWEGRALYLP